MSYGIFVPNTVSASSTPDNFKATALIAVVTATNWSGTATVTNYDSTKGFFFCQNLAGSLSGTPLGWAIPKCVWDNSTKVITWSVGGAGNINQYTWSNNFKILFFRYGVQ